MIRHTRTVSELRFFEDAEPAPMADFDASCLLVWDSPQVVQIRMLKGSLSRKLLRELVDWLDAMRIEHVRARRADGRLLPLGELQPDGSYIVDVRRLVERFMSKGASDFAPL